MSTISKTANDIAQELRKDFADVSKVTVSRRLKLKDSFHSKNLSLVKNDKGKTARREFALLH